MTRKHSATHRARVRPDLSSVWLLPDGAARASLAVDDVSPPAVCSYVIRDVRPDESNERVAIYRAAW